MAEWSTSSQCCFFFSCPSGSMTPIHLVLGIEYRSSRCYEACEMLHFSLSLMNKLNKPGPQVSFLFLGLGSLEGSIFLPEFLYRNIRMVKPFTFYTCVVVNEIWIACNASLSCSRLSGPDPGCYFEKKPRFSWTAP